MSLDVDLKVTSSWNQYRVPRAQVLAYLYTRALHNVIIRIGLDDIQRIICQKMSMLLIHHVHRFCLFFISNQVRESMFIVLCMMSKKERTLNCGPNWLKRKRRNKYCQQKWKGCVHIQGQAVFQLQQLHPPSIYLLYRLVEQNEVFVVRLVL